MALRQEPVFDMNTPEHNVEKTAEHEGFIKTPKQLITIIVLAFIVPIVVISLLIRLVIASSPMGVGSDAQSQEAVAKRIQPVAGFALVTADAAAEEKTGEQVYAATCSACHAAGVAGAHKFGDATAWAPIIAKGFEPLLQSVINGLGAMPPRAGNPALSDLELARAVVHITNAAGGNFPEPEAADAGGDEEAAAQEAPAEAAAAEEQPANEESAAQEAPAATAPTTEEAPPAEEAPAATATEASPQADAAAAETAADDIDLAAGEKLYKAVCFACHDFGVAGAPKQGDKAAWAPIIAGGMDQMIRVSIEGKGAMPPRGGSTASDEDIIAAVHYMVQQAQ